MFLEVIVLKESINYSIDSDRINKKLGLDQEKLKLSIKALDVLPFKTGSIKSDLNNISYLESFIFRELLGVKRIEDRDHKDILDKIVSSVDTEEKLALKDILSSIYFSDGEIKKFHPLIYLHSGNDSTGVKNISKYYINNIFNQNSLIYLREIMRKKPNSILEELLLKEFNVNITEDQIEMDNTVSIIPEIKDIFEEDFKTLCTKHQLFADNIDKLMKYYLFLYTSQVILKLRQGFSSEKKIENVYYFLSWEKISRNRKGYNQGWRMISKKSENIFAYVNTIQILNTTKNGKAVGSFDEIKSIINNMDEISNKLLMNDISNINRKIREVVGLDLNQNITNPIFGVNIEIDELLNTIIDCKDKGSANRKSAFDKYEKNIKHIADLGFIKPRGQAGSILSLDHSWIVFLTRLAIGSKGKIKLNDLWKEFERRGICFDSNSKQELLLYFEKINFLEKKSDSGDAQYVKIL